MTPGRASSPPSVVQTTAPGASRSPGEIAAEKAAEKRKLPSWLVSFVFHLLLLLILAILPVANMTSGPLDLILGRGGADAIAEFSLSGADSPMEAVPADSQIESIESQLDPGQLLNLQLPEIVDIQPTQTAEPVQRLAALPFGISAGLSGRSGQLKNDLLSKFGGTTETEAAVELGLIWLAKQQRSNGSWSLIGPYGEGGVSENATAATALALNAFLGAGYTHEEGKYRENIKLGLDFLVKRQASNGFYPDPKEPSRQQMYAQAIATITVAEAYGMSQDEKLQQSAQRAMSFAAWSQSRLLGWRYEPREDADLSVTGWFVMAMETGKMAGLKVDERALQDVTKFLDSVSHEDDSRYAYDDFDRASLSMTAEGLLCRIYLGWPRTHPALRRAIKDDLLANLPSMDARDTSVYYWYYATQVLHHVGGRDWEQWNRAMRKVLPALQEKRGPEAGSWSPEKDTFGAAGGRLYTTCLNLYCLEVYYRHLAIYDIR